MSTSSLPDTDSARAAISALFNDKSPVLVEVRFPKMGTSSDWFLCEEVADLDTILERLGPGVEVHLSSVWDLKDTVGPIIFRQ